LNGLSRRGGVWYARLAIPSRLRSVLNKTEFVASTGVREPAVALVVAAELLAGWRRRLHDLSRILEGCMDLDRIVAGHPSLLGGGYLAIAEAANVSGFDEASLLRAAADGHLQLYFRCDGRPGHLCSIEEFDRDIGVEGVTWIVPQPEQVSELAIPTFHFGVLRLREACLCASKFASGGSLDLVLFDLPEDPEQFFAPNRPIALASKDLELSSTQVERLRSAWALTVTPAQIEISRADKLIARPTTNPKSRTFGAGQSTSASLPC
jgi:hypothetical protein